MATIQRSLLGSISGRIGDLVVAHQNGIAVLKQAPLIKKHYNWSANQILQQLMFKKAAEFISPLTEILKIGWRKHRKRMWAHSDAMSYTLKNCFVDGALDFSKTLLAKGNLMLPANIKNIQKISSDLIFEWDGSSIDPNLTAFGILYCPARKDYALHTVGADEDMIASSVPSHWSGEIHAWLFFANTTFDINNKIVFAPGKKQVSNSHYCGKLTLPPGI
jgi:hypothetical protein